MTDNGNSGWGNPGSSGSSWGEGTRAEEGQWGGSVPQGAGNPGAEPNPGGEWGENHAFSRASEPKKGHGRVWAIVIAVLAIIALVAGGLFVAHDRGLIFADPFPRPEPAEEPCEPADLADTDFAPVLEAGELDLGDDDALRPTTVVNGFRECQPLSWVAVYGPTLESDDAGASGSASEVVEDTPGQPTVPDYNDDSDDHRMLLVPVTDDRAVGEFSSPVFPGNAEVLRVDPRTIRVGWDASYLDIELTEDRALVVEPHVKDRNFDFDDAVAATSVLGLGAAASDGAAKAEAKDADEDGDDDAGKEEKERCALVALEETDFWDVVEPYSVNERGLEELGYRVEHDDFFQGVPTRYDSSHNMLLKSSDVESATVDTCAELAGVLVSGALEIGGEPAWHSTSQIDQVLLFHKGEYIGPAEGPTDVENSRQNAQSVRQLDDSSVKIVWKLDLSEPDAPTAAYDGHDFDYVYTWDGSQASYELDE